MSQNKKVKLELEYNDLAVLETAMLERIGKLEYGIDQDKESGKVIPIEDLQQLERFKKCQRMLHKTKAKARKLV